MFGHRIAGGLALLCALVLSAFMASSASAITGTTGFTCAPEPNPGEKTKGFTDEHCTKEATGTTVKFIHTEIAENTKTIFHGTNEKTTPDTLGHEPATLSSSIGVEPVEISCTKVFAHGEQTNDKNETTKEHTIHSTNITILYTECQFTKPATCIVKGGKIEVKGVTATTAEQGDNVLFKPEVGTTFVTIEAEKCFGIAKFPVTGTVRGQVSGATLTFSEAGTTAEKTLTFNKAAAGLGGKLTLRQADGTLSTDKTNNPISATKVTT